MFEEHIKANANLHIVGEQTFNPDEWSEKYDAFVRDGLYRPARRQWAMDPPMRWRRFRSEIALLELRTALEIGCGNCGLIRWMQMNGVTMDGLDISAVSLRAFWSPELRGRPIQASVSDLSVIEDNLYDFIVCCDILEHLPDDNKVIAASLSELARVLSPSGVVVLWAAQSSSVSHKSHGQAHTCIRTQREWVKFFDVHFENYMTVYDGKKILYFGKHRC